MEVDVPEHMGLDQQIEKLLQFLNEYSVVLHILKNCINEMKN